MIDDTIAPPEALSCCRGTYHRDASSVWRYAWGDAVPGATDLTVADVIAIGADPLEVMVELGREVTPQLAAVLSAARRGELTVPRDGEGNPRVELIRRLGAFVCGMQAPELLGPALLDASQLARRLGVTRETIDSYRSRDRLPPPQVVRGRTPLWSAPVIRRWQSERVR